jgi:pyrroloquinoline quinone biosynthesis protein D
MDRYPVRSQDTAHRTLAGEAIAVNFKSSFFYALNEVATFIWERCDGQHRVADIAAALAAEYEVDPAEAARDCQQFLREMVAEGLLTWAPGP